MMRFRFVAMSPPHRDDADCVATPRPNQRKERTLDARRRFTAQLLGAWCRKGKRGPTIEEQGCVGKIEPASRERGLTLVLIPFKQHPDYSIRMHILLAHQGRRIKYVSMIHPMACRASARRRWISSATSASLPEIRISSGVPR